MEEATHTTYIMGEQAYYPRSTNQGNHYICRSLSHFTFYLPLQFLPSTPCTDIKCRYYFVCCRDGNYHENKKPRITSERRFHQKLSRKLNATCLSRMYVDELGDGTVSVKYIPMHTGHNPCPKEYPFLPLPFSVRETVSLELSKGIPAKRILQGKTKS